MNFDAKVTAFAKITGNNITPNIYGNIFFDDVAGGTEVYIQIWGLPLYEPAKNFKEPIGPFGFHVHEYGICEVTDPENPFQSAGGHYNPTNQLHGNHAGDFPVIFSNNGYARMSFFTDKFKPKDIIGKSVIIHQNPDDYRTQPTGDAGKRIGCGVICRLY